MGLLPRLSKQRKAAIAETLTLRLTLQLGPSIPHARSRGGQPVLFLPHNQTMMQTLVPPLVPTPEEDEDEDDPFLEPPTSDLPDIEGMFPEDSDVEEADVNETTPSPWRSLDEDDRSSDTSFLGRISRIKVLAGNAGIAHAYRALRVFMRSGAGTTESHCDIYDIVIHPCECAPVPGWLLESGVFPCVPLHPSLAVDVRLLEFTMKLFVRIAPNKSALTGALVAHLGDLGFKLASQDAMRRQFTAALEWYTYLRHRVDAHLDRVLELKRESTGAAAAPHAEVEEGPNGPRGSPERDEAEVHSTTHVRAHSEHGQSRGRHPAMPPASPTLPSPQRGRRTAGNKRKRGETPETPEAESNLFPDPPPRLRPSDYLHARCPACFGGDKYAPEDLANIKVCVDACFTQKKNKSAPDPPKHHPGTHFVREDVSDRMETYVDAVRESRTSKRQRKRARADENVAVVNSDDEEDGYEHSELPLPRSVLRSCEASFKAADEKRAKASTKLHNDTGLMALLCRHDRVLWVVNMHSAGEKQFYMLLLIETLFQHLPLTTTVGLLYDIACQLERSARKWGFLDRYLQRLIFAVAVFHAFGHDWPCQLVYHPRSFGFTNGEGCERLWESISHLIAHLRVSSYHHRLYTLDTQVKHADENSLFRLAEWNKRRSVHSAGKRSDAMLVLEECEVTVEVLRGEWEKQVKAQTKPLARRSKNLVQKAVEQILSLWDAVKIRKSQVQAAESAALQAIEDEDGNAIQETKTEVKKAKAALREAETVPAVNNALYSRPPTYD
ncbi:hypothetical protein B0H11DRAFT_2260038 [Mycena galericulata]|nr:hypothetical protein B0H11DRAFT_2260038 [Mycena galericulata]